MEGVITGFVHYYGKTKQKVGKFRISNCELRIANCGMGGRRDVGLRRDAETGGRDAHPTRDGMRELRISEGAVALGGDVRVSQSKTAPGFSHRLEADATVLEAVLLWRGALANAVARLINHRRDRACIAVTKHCGHGADATSADAMSLFCPEIAVAGVAQAGDDVAGAI
jgi:hypothetical protein